MKPNNQQKLFINDDSITEEPQIVSKKRVADHGEVYTGKREVIAMLDLVTQEAERIESRFLEPACGTGNFISEILERKLRIVDSRYGKSQLDYERNAILAISSIYGIDILEDNIIECRERLFQIFNLQYTNLFKNKAKPECRKAAQYILRKNIVWGDALTLKKVDGGHQPIIFSEWSPVRGSMFKRRDFAFCELIPSAQSFELTLFSANKWPIYSDLGKEIFIPMPIKEYPLIHFLRIVDADE